jgi:hypothetical protein
LLDASDGRDGAQMVRARKHMNESDRKASEEGRDHDRTQTRWLSAPLNGSNVIVIR